MSLQNVTLFHKIDVGLHMMRSELVMLFAIGVAPSMWTKVA